MSIAEANLDLPANFAGIVKVFPLPNLVLFPGVIQPLHIFEPRYRALMRDALDSDQLIGMATLKPGWESSDARRPAIYPTLCVGKIVTHAELPDGRFNLLLCGADAPGSFGKYLPNCHIAWPMCDWLRSTHSIHPTSWRHRCENEFWSCLRNW